ncbi:MAG: hypothetical protein V1933_06045 [Candidatus Omnitrophota bacterium]
MLFQTYLWAGAEPQLYKGFPVYPPEGIPILKKTNSVKLDLRFVDAPDGCYIYDPNCSFQAWKEKEDKFLKKINEARNYILSNAKNYGWKVADEYSYDDGGSFGWKFIKGDSNSLYVNVTIWCGMGASQERGIISYSFNE